LQTKATRGRGAAGPPAAEAPTAASLSEEVGLLLRDHRASCSATILTTVISGRQDWQRHRHIQPSFSYFREFYKSVLSIPGGRAHAIVLHDGLPPSITDQYAAPDGSFSFVKVNLSNFGPDLGVNDVRYMLFREQLAAHPEWDTVFMTDASDVTLRHNPCQLVADAPERVYIGSESSDLKHNPFMRERFKEMGGKYLVWFKSLPDGHVNLWNAGVIGGKRAKMLELTSRIVDVLNDPELAVRQEKKEVNVNMGALNWVILNFYAPGEVGSGEPMHTHYKKYQRMREDVYFIHK